MGSIAWAQLPATWPPREPATEMEWSDWSAAGSPRFQRMPLPMPPKPPQVPGGAYDWLYRGSIACGGGVAYSEPEREPTLACGLGMTVFPGVVTEFGVMGPALNRHDFTVYWSEDATVPLPLPKPFVRRTRGHPIVLGGYTRMFETGRNALDYGVGFERHVDQYHSLQVELRDYWTFATPQQHNVMIRIVWVTGIPD